MCVSLMCSQSLLYIYSVLTRTNRSFMYTKCNTKHTWRQHCDLKWLRRFSLCCDPRGWHFHRGGEAGVMPRNWRGKIGPKALCLQGLKPRSRWCSAENGVPGSHQSPAPSRLSWFPCTGRWRSRPHWTVSPPPRRNPPDCRRCLIASWWPRWRAGPAGAPFPPHLHKHRRWDLRFRRVIGWCENGKCTRTYRRG